MAALVLVSVATGCPSDSDGDGGSTTNDDGSSTSASGTSSETPTTTMEATSEAPTTDATEATTDAESSSSTAADTSSGSAESSSSGGPPCEPGTAECSCDEGSCDDGLECIEGLCLDPAGCQGNRQDAEPNDSEATAVSLPDAECGTLYDAPGSVELDDEDWFVFSTVDLGEDCPGSDGTIAIVTATEDLEVCMFFDCDAGAASVNCPTDEEATSPDGLPGCCGVGSVEPAHFCTGIDNNGTAALRVGGLESQMCVDYEVAYRFQ